jgi:hypothetical protein
MRSLVIALLLLVAGPARADQAPAPTAARLLHVPPLEAAPDRDVELVAAIDGAWREADLVARWRRRGDTVWHDAPFRRSSAGGWYATIPGEGVGRAGVEYFIAGAEAVHFASAESPHTIAVVPLEVEQLAEGDRRRNRGRDDEVRVDVEGHQFGNRFEDDQGPRDHYLRAESTWIHRFYRILYATSFGFGAIEGATPDASAADAMELATSSRYGFGELRLRVHPSIFVDGRLALGISHAGFIGGAAGRITLGRPWSTSVSAGAEYLDDLGPSAFIRLQWDTAPPLLMGASIVRTDLPGAVLDDGVLVRYDVSLRVAGRFTSRAAVSVGARDGAPHFGGGLGLGYEF